MRTEMEKKRTWEINEIIEMLEMIEIVLINSNQKLQ